MMDDVDPNKDFDAGGARRDAQEAAIAATEKGQQPEQPEAKAPEVLPAQPEAGKVQPLVARPDQLTAQEGGVLKGKTLEEQWRLAQYYCKSGLMPRGLNTPEKVLVGIQMCHELQLPVISSIGKIMVVNGSPSLFGELPLAIVRRSGLLEDFHEEFLVDQKTREFIGVRCTVQRKGVKRPVEREFTMDDAKRAGLLGKDTWKGYPKRMCQFRARAWALKDLFADVLGGASIGEWDGDVGTGPAMADELNDAYLDKPAEKEVAPEAGA